jgi:hypothetical protein
MGGSNPLIGGSARESISALAAPAHLRTFRCPVSVWLCRGMNRDYLSFNGVAFARHELPKLRQRGRLRESPHPCFQTCDATR